MDKEFLKWVIVLGSMPFWLPFLRALWEELNLAMREDGGLYGQEPGPIQREQIRQELAMEEPKLVSETLAHRRTKGTVSATGRAKPPSPKGPAYQAGPQMGPTARKRVSKPVSRARGFR